MGVYVRDIYFGLSNAGVEAAVCCIKQTDMFDDVICVSDAFPAGASRYWLLLLLYAKLMFVSLLRKNVVILNVSQEFIAPIFWRRRIVIFHDLIQYYRPRNGFMRSYMRLMIGMSRISTRNIAVSRTISDQLRKWSVKSVVVHNHFDISFLKRFRTTGERTFDGCWCGTAAPHKNLQLFLDLAASRPNSRFALILPREDATSANLSANVSLFSDLSHDAYFKVLASAKVMISTSSMEGYGRPPMEALLLGARLCLSDIPVYREIYGAWATFFDDALACLQRKFDETVAKPPPAAYPTELSLGAVTGRIEDIVDIVLAEWKAPQAAKPTRDGVEFR